MQQRSHKWFCKNTLIATLIILSSLQFIPALSQVCLSGEYFNGQRCAPCKSNCLCSSQYGCDDCLPGYAFDATFSNCLQCPLASDSINIGCKECCSQIAGTSFVCSQCDTSLEYVFLKGGQCLRIQGCTDINSMGLCLNCIAGYYLQEGKCLPCDTTCATCMDNTLCLTCSSGHYNANNVHMALCSACPTGCATCTSAVVCDSCMQRYYLTGSTCTACSSNCLECTASGCLRCDTTLSTLISGVCHLCTDVSKSGSTGCTSCITNSGSNLIECQVCSSGYYLSNGQCTLCSSTFPNSILCTSTQPLQCSNDHSLTLSSRYYLLNNQCIPNTNLCKTMQTNTTTGLCSQCYFDSTYGYYQLTASNTCSLCSQTGCSTYSTTCQCQSCLDGYRFVNNLCVACQNLHCIKCQQNVQSCEQCSVGYGRFSSACIVCSKGNCQNCDGDYTVCSRCNNGYFLSNGTCYQCQQNCLTCESNVKCTVCATGYYLQENGRCQVLPSNCVEVKEETNSSSSLSTDSSNSGSSAIVANCKKCQYGYQVIEGNCYPCSHSLYNLNECEKFCPTYYALLASEGHLTIGFKLMVIMGLVMMAILTGTV